MYGFENRHSAPVCTFVALMTNRGPSGRSCSVASPKRCLRYAPATLSEIVPGSRMPPKTEPLSIVCRRELAQRLDELLVEVGRDAVRVELQLRPVQRRASPAVIDPPDTLETRSSFGR